MYQILILLAFKTLIAMICNNSVAILQTSIICDLSYSDHEHSDDSLVNFLLRELWSDYEVGLCLWIYFIEGYEKVILVQDFLILIFTA